MVSPLLTLELIDLRCTCSLIFSSIDPYLWFFTFLFIVFYTAGYPSQFFFSVCYMLFLDIQQPIEHGWVLKQSYMIFPQLHGSTFTECPKSTSSNSPSCSNFWVHILFISFHNVLVLMTNDHLQSKYLHFFSVFLKLLFTMYIFICLIQNPLRSTAPLHFSYLRIITPLVHVINKPCTLRPKHV